MTTSTIAKLDTNIPQPFPPPWACAWEDDRYGIWADAELQIGVESSKQCMRWVAPGSFQMGSPETEAARFEVEGPQHRVPLVKSFGSLTPHVPRILAGGDGGQSQPFSCEKPGWAGTSGGTGELGHDSRVFAKVAEYVAGVPVHFADRGRVGIRLSFR